MFDLFGTELGLFLTGLFTNVVLTRQGGFDMGEFKKKTPLLHAADVVILKKTFL